MVGQTFITALVALRTTSTSTLSPTLSVSPAEMTIINSLNRVLGAMESLNDTCPLIGAWPHRCQCDRDADQPLSSASELAKLRTTISENQAYVLV